MEKKNLGSTDIKVSKICLWTMTWGHQNTEEEAYEQLDYALSNGINFVDTAELYSVPPSKETYGKTEEFIWNWFEKTWNRKNVILASKVAWPSFFRHIRGWSGFSREGILSALEDSLKRLKTDYIDLYQLHWPERSVQLWWKLNYDEKNHSEWSNEKIEEILSVLKEIQDSWKVRYFGLSNETPWGLMKFLEIAKNKNYPEIVSIQNCYNIIRRDYEVGLSEISMEEWVWLLAYSPLAWWILSWKYNDWKFPPKARFSTWWKGRMGYYLNDKTFSCIKELEKLALELWISLTELCLAFVNDRKFVSSNIIWATSMEQLKECIWSAKISLNDEARNKIDEIFTAYPNPACF